MKQYKLKEHVTDEMLIECGFYKTPLQHYRFDVSNNSHVIIDKNTREVSAVIYDYKSLKLVKIESNKLQDLIELDYVEVIIND